MERTPKQVAEMLGLTLADGKGDRDFVRPMGVTGTESARNRALAKGWLVDPPQESDDVQTG